MSYNDFVDRDLINVGFAGAIILSHDGNVKASMNANIGGEETKILSNLFSNPSDSINKSISIGGKEYVIERADAKSIFAKMKENQFVHLAASKTPQSIIVGIYDDRGRKDGHLAIESLADYFRANNL